MQYKIENDQLIPAPVNFVTPDGRTICNFNLSVKFMNQYGYTVTEEEAEEWRKEHPEPPAPPAPPRTTCTKYELVRVLREEYPEEFESLRQAYASNADVQFYWNTVNELDRNNQDFLTLVTSLGFTEEQIDEVFSKL